MSETETIYELLTCKFSAEDTNQVSARERKRLEPSLTYGEVEFPALAQVIASVRDFLVPQAVFYDLGSGSGKALVAAALLFPFSKCVGIEVLRGVHDIAVEVKMQYDSMKPQLLADHPSLFESLAEIELIHGDFLEFSYWDAGLVFINSACYSSELMAQIADLPFAQNTVVVTSSKPFQSPKWTVFTTLELEMSWGPGIVFIQQHLG